MKEFIALDVHKFYSLLEREMIDSGQCQQFRIEHHRGAIRSGLSRVEPGTAVAVEATGNWYWIVEEIEQSGGVPQLVHPRKAKLMMGMINKTDKLDVHGLNRLQRNGTLPTVWIPPGPLRDLRELTRTRMVLVGMRTRLKNRILATLSKYALGLEEEASDPFGVEARQRMRERLKRLPEQTRQVTEELLKLLEEVERQTEQEESRLRALLKVTPEMELVKTLPGVGLILAAVITMEIGDIGRFASAEQLASYSGTVPRIKASGDKVRYGQLRSDVNRYLKWAFMEAANIICIHRHREPQRHVSRLYERIADRKGHPKAIGAVARHLAEACFYVLSRNEAYRDPSLKSRQSKGT
jgi:transposase